MFCIIVDNDWFVYELDIYLIILLLVVCILVMVVMQLGFCVVFGLLFGFRMIVVGIDVVVVVNVFYCVVLVFDGQMQDGISSFLVLVCGVFISVFDIRVNVVYVVCVNLCFVLFSCDVMVSVVDVGECFFV